MFLHSTSHKSLLVATLYSIVFSTTAAAQVHIDAQGRVSRPSQTGEETPPQSQQVVDPKLAASPLPPDQVQRQAIPPEAPMPQREERRQPSLEEGGELHLVCGGAGAANKVDYTNRSGTFSGNFDSFGSNGFNSGSVSGTTSESEWGTRVQGFADEVSLSMTSEDGRLRMPPVMLPPLRGGDNGWFELSDIEIEPGEIRATINVNFMNHPQLRLDRRTGSINISGRAGNYVGQCERFEPNQVQRRF